MSSRRRRRSRRGLILTAGGLCGLVLGLVIVSVATGGGVKKAPAPYAPFPAGSSERIERTVARGGPIFYSDPKGGTNAFFLDVLDGRIVALAAVPPGGDASCPATWDRRRQRYQDCEGTEIPVEALGRFRVILQGQGPDKTVLVDIRSFDPPQAPPS